MSRGLIALAGACVLLILLALYLSRPETPAAALARVASAQPQTQAGSALASPFSSVAGLAPAAPASPLQQDLQAYQNGGLDPAQKRSMRQAMAGRKRDPQMRAQMVAAFYGAAGASAASAMYSILRDGKFKDSTLLAELIAHPHSAERVEYAARIVDLIADLDAQAPYAAQIDSYLARLAHSPGPLRESAASRRLWYLQQHQPYQHSLAQAYLQDASPALRAEVYGLLQQNWSAYSQAERQQWQAVLQQAVQHGPARALAQEVAQLQALLQALAA
ncbi:hypothetical protein V8J88_15100 [Massilia sp. W12]|uniref:hypothetical protein n=1 Tax=Massilia sp. W12 TaxID=3126507 RepID=UPI0030CE6F83